MTLRRRRFLGLSILLLALAGFGIYFYLAKHNKSVKEWHETPLSLKALAGIQAAETIGNRILSPEIDSSYVNQITAKQVRHSVKLGANWILSMQEKTGRFQYWYNPEIDKYSHKNDDNFLRQAGTAYSLMLCYETLHDTTFLEGAKRSIEYLMQFRKILNDSTTYFQFRGKAKLGGVALPMLSMIKLFAVQQDSTYLQEMKKLSNMIITLQKKYANGKFKSTYVYHGDYEFEKHSGWESSIYPGEAMLALALMYKNFKHEKYKSSFDLAMDYYASKGNWKMSGFIPWAVSACSEMYLFTKEEKYADFAFEMCNYGLRWQNLNPAFISYGSIYPMPSVFTATTFEGIGDAIRVAEEIGDQEKADFFIKRSMIAYTWIMKLQYRNEKNNPTAYGGFRSSLYNPKIRIDNTQHAISALNKGLKNIFKEKAIAK